MSSPMSYRSLRTGTAIFAPFPPQPPKLNDGAISYAYANPYAWGLYWDGALKIWPMSEKISSSVSKG